MPHCGLLLRERTPAQLRRAADRYRSRHSFAQRKATISDDSTLGPQQRDGFDEFHLGHGFHLPEYAGSLMFHRVPLRAESDGDLLDGESFNQQVQYLALARS